MPFNAIGRGLSEYKKIADLYWGKADAEEEDEEGEGGGAKKTLPDGKKKKLLRLLLQ